MGSYDKDLKMRVAANIESMVSRHIFTFPKPFEDVLDTEVHRADNLEWTIRVKTQTHGIHYYRLRLAEML